MAGCLRVSKYATYFMPLVCYLYSHILLASETFASETAKHPSEKTKNPRANSTAVFCVLNLLELANFLSFVGAYDELKITD